MPKKRHPLEEIIRRLREAEYLGSGVGTASETCRSSWKPIPRSANSLPRSA